MSQITARCSIQGGTKNRPFLKVRDSCIWWGKKAFNIRTCSALHQE